MNLSYYVLTALSSAALLSACATRTPPGAHPETSAASPRAKEAPPAEVARALSADAPWSDAGVKAGDASAAHQHQGHHHGH